MGGRERGVRREVGGRAEGGGRDGRGETGRGRRESRKIGGPTSLGWGHPAADKPRKNRGGKWEEVNR